MMEALGSMVIGGVSLFGYNRKNYMYDRKMRQEQEFTIAEMRLKQADLWREDVRDITELTERKMDSYLIVNALQLGFTVTMFIEGRLEQGTPQWLLWLYLLSLSGAFLFLLLSVWLSMHASVVAQSSSVRLLTQLVRLPVPSWEQLESMRTYAASFEGVPMKQMFRVPMVQTMSEGRQAGAGGYSGPSDAEPGSVATDPWGLERRGDDIYELSRGPLTSTRHLRLLREASKHWRAYDAFSRASLSLGTIMMCQGLGYFVLGYALINDGAPWAAWTVMGVMLTIACTVLRMDVSMARSECYRAQLLLVSGPALACIAGAEWATWRTSTQHMAALLLPLCYACHALFLLTFLRLCRVAEVPSGAMLPLSFQSVLFTDIFSWLSRGGKPTPPPEDPSTLLPAASVQKAPTGYTGLKLVSMTDSCKDVATFADESFELSVAKAPAGDAEVDFATAAKPPKGSDRSSLASWCSTAVPRADVGDEEHVGSDLGSATASSSDRGLGPSPMTEQLLPQPGAGLEQPRGPPAVLGPGGQTKSSYASLGKDGAMGGGYSGRSSLEDKRARRRSRGLFALHSQTFPRQFPQFDCKADAALRPEDVEIKAFGREDSSDEELMSPGHMPSMRSRTHHPMEGVGPEGVIPQASAMTFEAATFAPEPSPEFDAGGDPATGRDLHDPGVLPWHLFRGGVRFLSGLWLLGVVWAVAQAAGLPDVPDKVLPASVSVSEQRSPREAESHWGSGSSPVERFLPAGSRVEATWPSARFQPRGLSADPTGRYLAIADEFDIYFASLAEERRLSADGAGKEAGAADRATTSYRLASFQPAPQCSALEGQAIRDVAVLCESGGTSTEEPSCEVLILHARGHRLAACRLSPTGLSGPGFEAAVDRGLEELGSSNASSNVWDVAGKWLRDLGDGRKKEEVVSVVVDMECGSSASLDQKDSCVVVGTNHGRMVQLRRHMRHTGELVPAGALWNVLGKAALDEQVEGMATSLLTAIPGGFVVALREGQRYVHAIDVKHKRVVGKWAVPQLPGRTWSAIAGGADALYLTNQGGACTDTPEGWMDAKGYTCSNYAERKWCTSTGEYGRGWFVLWGEFKRYTNFGQTAATACCECGGGDREDHVASSEIWRFPLPEELQQGVNRRWSPRRAPTHGNAEGEPIRD